MREGQKKIRKLEDVGSEYISCSIYKFFEVRLEYNNLLSTIRMIFKVILGKQIHLINSNDKKKFIQFLAFIPSIFKSLPSRYTLNYIDEDGDEITLKDQSDYEVLLDSGFKTVKVNIRENNEEFMEMTNEIQIQPAYERMVEEDIQIREIQKKVSEIKLKEEVSKIEEESIPEIQDSMIEDKLRKMMPDIISRIKTEISEDIKEKSRISMKNSSISEPIITEQPRSSKPEIKQEKVVVHERVNCDGCGQKGIIGIRYKCAVCPDFDFCSKCQATIEHEHPFLKIKTLSQTPLKIFTVINHEDDSQLEVNGHKVHIPSGLEGLVHQGMNLFDGFLRNSSHGQARRHCRQMFGRGMGCPMKKQKAGQQTQAKVETKVEEKVEPKVEPKVEVKVEAKVEVKPEKKVEKQKEEVDQVIHKNALYLEEVFGFQFPKCLRWAQQFPYMTKEQLLNHCISTPEFYN